MRVQKLLKLTLTRLDQGLGALALQCLNLERTCPIMQSHPLFLLQSPAESRSLIAAIFKISIGTSMLMNVGTQLHIAPLVSQTMRALIIMPQLHQPRVFVETHSSDLTPISLITCPILSHLRQS